MLNESTAKEVFNQLARDMIQIYWSTLDNVFRPDNLIVCPNQYERMQHE